ncbi:MAG: NADH-quinone oxidoreductase subunit C [Chloroflexi bacterium]|nr:NADH-quinone oxidoreductase subunit C [Chloroflexota bacterium]
MTMRQVIHVPNRLTEAMGAFDLELSPHILSLYPVDTHTICMETKKEYLLSVVQYARESPHLSIDFMSCISGVDMREYLLLVYHFHSLSRNLTLQIKTKLDRTAPEIDSLTSTWPAANWYEREAYDLLGIVFRGHPNLTRILTEEGFEGFPLRKDFALPVENHKEDVGAK